jgi:chaperonin GroEL
MGRYALLIGTNAYADPMLSRLRSPRADVRRLAAVLRDPQQGDFDDVEVLDDRLQADLVRAIEDFTADRDPADELLVYLSCHGFQDLHGELYFAATNTKTDRPGRTAIDARFIDRFLGNSFARSRVLLLDCCFSGAFTRTCPLVDPLGDKFSGGYVVITACNEFEYAIEGDQVDPKDVAPSGSPASCWTRCTTPRPIRTTTVGYRTTSCSRPSRSGWRRAAGVPRPLG